MGNLRLKDEDRRLDVLRLRRRSNLFTRYPSSLNPLTGLRLGEGILLLLAAPFLLFPTVSLPITILMLVLLATSWLAALLFTGRVDLPRTPFNVIFLVWGLFIAVSILVSADPDLSMPKATGIILGLATWRYLALVVRRRRHLYPAFLLFILAALAFVLVGILSLQAMLKIRFLADLAPVQRLALPGNTSDAVHPNLLAGTICLFLPFVVGVLVTWRPARYRQAIRFGLLLITVLTLLILVLTQSRSGWIGMSAGLLTLFGAWAILLPPSRPRMALRLSLLAVALTGLLVIVLAGPQRIQQLWLDPPEQTIIGTFATLNYRRELWPWALAAVSDFPFTGVGLGAFRAVLLRLYPSSLSTANDIGHAHNIFLQTALDFGLPGLVAYLAALLLAGALLWRMARLDGQLRPFALGLFACLVAFHAFGIADAVAVGAKPGLLYWLLLGLVTAMNRVSRRGFLDEEPAETPAAAGITAHVPQAHDRHHMIHRTPPIRQDG
jgi:putative inorganic carbon (HCO3(-)) transporter